MKKKIYISGGMTGIPEYNASAFSKAEKMLTKKGFECVNPFTVGRGLEDKLNLCTKEEKYFVFMEADINELMKCDCIYLLNGWEKSKGANLENTIATFFGLDIIYQNELDSDSVESET